MPEAPLALLPSPPSPSPKAEEAFVEENGGISKSSNPFIATFDVAWEGKAVLLVVKECGGAFRLILVGGDGAVVAVELLLVLFDESSKACDCAEGLGPLVLDSVAA